MRRMKRTLACLVIAMVMAASVGGTVSAKTYFMSEILEEVHQGKNWTSPYYLFEGSEELMWSMLPSNK